MAQITGYTIEMIRNPLYLLAKFISDNLETSQLDHFDLESIKTLSSESVIDNWIVSENVLMWNIIVYNN